MQFACIGLYIYTYIYNTIGHVLSWPFYGQCFWLSKPQSSTCSTQARWVKHQKPLQWTTEGFQSLHGANDPSLAATEGSKHSHAIPSMYGIFPYIWLIFMIPYMDPMGMTLIHFWWSFWSYNLRLLLKGLLPIPSIDTARNTIWYGNHTHIHTHTNKHLVFEYILHYMFLRVH